MADPLLEEIEAFLRLTGMSPTRFSIRATRDRHFVRHLRKGRNVWPGTMDRVRAFMRGFDPAQEPPPVRRGRAPANAGIQSPAPAA
ncbi:hypothetical protein [Sphingomonas sanxanigenens]|uniref:hypothetical protein n=1 Tax=Sphingomonas sanxanigenens TaxID=397260 RepID=UPI00069C89C5|nr:hypothetical protein [Sphingomonas sanxanigenens]